MHVSAAPNSRLKIHRQPLWACSGTNGTRKAFTHAIFFKWVDMSVLRWFSFNFVSENLWMVPVPTKIRVSRVPTSTISLAAFRCCKLGRSPLSKSAFYFSLPLELFIPLLCSEWDIMAPQTSGVALGPGGVPKKKPISYSNLLLGAGLNMFEYVSLSAWA